MTIVTKPKTEKKPLVNYELEGGECLVVDPKAPGTASAVVVDEEIWPSRGTRRCFTTTTRVCVTITALLVMSIGITGGVYLYRQFSAHERARFRGWCSIPYDHEALMGHPKLPLGNPLQIYSSNRAVYKGDDNPELIPERLFKEEFNLDLEDDEYEEIHVPDFGLRRQGRFIHDFRANMTGIIDLTYHRCYVMPLDRSHVLPPRSVYDLIKKMWMGYYNVDTQVVRETMRVVQPAVKDYQPLGVYISNYCATFPTYNLERLYIHDIKKRSVDEPGEEEGIQFAEFAGKNIIHFIILGGDEESAQ